MAKRHKREREREREKKKSENMGTFFPHLKHNCKNIFVSTLRSCGELTLEDKIFRKLDWMTAIVQQL